MQDSIPFFAVGHSSSYCGNYEAGTKFLFRPCYSLRLERGIHRYSFRRRRFALCINTSSLVVGFTQVAAFLWKLVAPWQNIPRSGTFTWSISSHISHQGLTKTCSEEYAPLRA